MKKNGAQNSFAKKIVHKKIRKKKYTKKIHEKNNAQK